MLAKLNLVRFVCLHLVGENHTSGHRLIVGSAVIFVGVFIAKSGGAFHGPLHFILDALGYLVHGIGAVPFVEAVTAVEKVNDAKPAPEPELEESKAA